MNLEEAQRLLLDPRALTREQWLAAYEAIQERNIRGLGPASTPRRPADGQALAEAIEHSGGPAVLDPLARDFAAKQGQ